MSQQEKRCMSCMNPLPDGRQECGICGVSANRQNDADFLRAGVVLSKRYLVGKMLRYTGDAAEYIGYDLVLKGTIRIREFYPGTLCRRGKSGEISINSGSELSFNDLLDKFRAHARTLARLRELSNIEAVYDIFDAGNSAYTVAEFVTGSTLEERLAATGNIMRWQEARPLFMPLLATVASLHAAGIYHLGICPENIIIGSAGKLHLQGFCMPEARKAGSDLTPDLINGYSAPEQYSTGAEIGAYTDVYGMGATLFRVLTGNPMPDGAHRAKDSNDLFVPNEVAQNLPKHVALAMFQSLQVNPRQRSQTVSELREKLSTAPAVTDLLSEDEDAANQPEPPAPKKKRSRAKTSVMIVLIAFVIMLVLAGALLMVMYGDQLFGKEEESRLTSDNTPVITEAPTTAATKNTANLHEVTSIVGKNISDYVETFGAGAFKLEKVWVYDDKKDFGTILTQENTGKKLAYGSKVKVTISMGSELVEIPKDMKGEKDYLVKMILESRGLKVIIMPMTESDVERGLVDHIDKEGEKVKRGTEVALYVSDAEPTTQPTDDEDYFE